MTRAQHLLTLSQAGAFFFLLIAFMMDFVSPQSVTPVMLCLLAAFIVPTYLAFKDERNAEENQNG